MKAKFVQWNIPFALIPLKSREMEIRVGLRTAAQKISPAIPNPRLNIITRAYSNALEALF